MTKPGGSIPASAGQPPPTVDRPSQRPGLSPRVRGNHRDSTGSRWRLSKVYPRECGATSVQLPGEYKVQGSIPASAGQPDGRLPWSRNLSEAVYPRECGATAYSSAGQMTPCKNCGLSPRVRGNRQVQRRDDFHWGSIPASAGQPCANWRHSTLGRSIPASAGQPLLEPSRSLRMPSGLSPRVRGNLPAAPWPVMQRDRAVYPRECGATVTTFTMSIPAVGRVYPRECGATLNGWLPC